MFKFWTSAGGKEGSGKRTAQEGKRRGNVSIRMVLIWTQRVLLVSGVALIGVYGAARIESLIASDIALKKFTAEQTALDALGTESEETVPRGDESSVSEQMDLPDVDFSLWGERRARAYKRGIEKQSGIPLAVLRIPKIHLEAPLLEGTDDLTLNHAVGRIAGTARPGEQGNIGIAGHRDSFFRGLKDVSVGDAI